MDHLINLLVSQPWCYVQVVVVNNMSHLNHEIDIIIHVVIWQGKPHVYRWPLNLYSSKHVMSYIRGFVLYTFRGQWYKEGIFCPRMMCYLLPKTFQQDSWLFICKKKINFRLFDKHAFSVSCLEIPYSSNSVKWRHGVY